MALEISPWKAVAVTIPSIFAPVLFKVLIPAITADPPIVALPVTPNAAPNVVSPVTPNVVDTVAAPVT